MIRERVSRYRLFVAVVIIIVLNTSTCFARCPIHGLRVTVLLEERAHTGKVYAQIEDKFGPTRVELQKEQQGTYRGLLPFSTMGFVFFVEWSCSYFPDNVTIYVDDAVQTVKLDWDNLTKTMRTGDSQFVYIFDIDVDLRAKGSGEKEGHP